MRPDISAMSDEELMRIAGGSQAKPDISSMSDEELMKIADTKQPNISRGEAALTTFTNIPFAPRIKAGIAAGVAKTFGGKATEDESLKSLYEEGLNNELNKLNQARQQYPVQSFVTQLPSDVIIASKLGPAGRGVTGTATTSGLQAIGETKDLTDVSDVAGKGIGSAILSAATYGVLKGAGKGYEKVFAPKAQKMTADEVRALASNAYKEATQRGGIVKKDFINNLIKKSQEFDKQTVIGKALAGDSPISKISETLGMFADKKLDLSSLQELDEALGDVIDNYVENGVIKKAGLPVLRLQNNLRDMIDKVQPNLIEGGKEGFEALKRGRELWSKSAKLRDIEKIITRAEMSDNPATAIKTGFRTLFNNADKLKYFNQEERRLIKKAAQSGIIEDTLRTMGSRLIPIGSVVAGGGLSSAITAQAATMASRGLASKAQLARANKLAEQIISGKLPMPTKTNPLLNAVLAARTGSTIINNQ